MTRANRYYLNKRDSKLFGVCAGLADKFGIEPLWVRVGAVTLTILVSFVTIPIYVIVALLAEARPPSLYYDDVEEQRFWERASRGGERNSRMRSNISEMDRRVADIEAIYSRSSTSRLSGEIDRLR